jgi:hypothetical protein
VGVRIDEAWNDRQTAAIDLFIHGCVDDVSRQVRIAAGEGDPVAISREGTVGNDGDVPLLRSRSRRPPGAGDQLADVSNGQQAGQRSGTLAEKTGRDIVR